MGTLHTKHHMHRHLSDLHHIYDADLKGDDACGATHGGPPPEILISEMTIQGSVYVQNLMENETIKSYFEFAHIRHTYGTFFGIWAKFPRFWLDFSCPKPLNVIMFVTVNIETDFFDNSFAR